jgi:peptide/nickel transport system substrate-binding protein
VEAAGRGSQVQDDALELVSRDLARASASRLFRQAEPARHPARARALGRPLVMSVWSGLENGIPTSDMPPEDLRAGARRLSCPGHALGRLLRDPMALGGEVPDWAPAVRLMELYRLLARMSTSQGGARAQSGTRCWPSTPRKRSGSAWCPSVPSAGGREGSSENVPLEGIYGWDPGAHFGIHRMDEFYLTD